MEELSLNIQLMKTFRRLGNLISTKATPFQGQRRILNLIRKKKKQISQRELLEKTNMKSASLSEIVINLENNNLITNGHTSIFIAHRLSTIKDSDLIVLLDNGKILEQGTHEEFLILNGRYSQMYNLQTGKIEEISNLAR